MGAFVDYKFAQIEGLGTDDPVKLLARVYEGDYQQVDQDGVLVQQYTRQRMLEELTLTFKPGTTTAQLRSYMNKQLTQRVTKTAVPSQITGGVGADPATVRVPSVLSVSIKDATLGA